MSCLGMFATLFGVLVIVYITLCFKGMTNIDICALIFSVIVLLINIRFKSFPLAVTESFTSSVAHASSYQSTWENGLPIQIDEDISQMASMCKLYTTVFNTTSYSGSGKQWNNVATTTDNIKDSSSLDSETQCKHVSLSRSKLMFDNIPTFSKANGFVMSTNRLIGPMCNELGVNLTNPFTIFLSFRNGTFIPEPVYNVNILKLYGNSQNNNALSLFITNDTISVENGVQSGDLKLMWTDDTKNLLTCRLNDDDDTFVFEKDNIITLFIVRNTEDIKVLYAVGDRIDIKELGSKALAATTVTFANKELEINKSNTWKANMYAFGIMDGAITNASAVSIHRHLYGEHLKANNQMLQDMMIAHNDMLNYINSFRQCPLDTSTCDACSTITDWTNTVSIVQATTPCRNAINKYCQRNPQTSMCSCWNANSPDFMTDQCKMFRAIFESGSNSFLSALTQSDLDYLSKTYNLINVSNCPPPSPCDCSRVNLVNNTYRDIDYDQMRIDPRGIVRGHAKSRIVSPYELENPTITSYGSVAPMFTSNAYTDSLVSSLPQTDNRASYQMTSPATLSSSSAQQGTSSSLMKNILNIFGIKS